MSRAIQKEVDSIPLGDRVLVKIEKKEVIRNGLIIPEVGEKLAQEGVVVTIGDGWDCGSYKPIPQIKKGDRIIFGKYAGTEVKLDGEDHVIMGFGDVLGVVETADCCVSE